MTREALSTENNANLTNSVPNQANQGGFLDPTRSQFYPAYPICVVCPATCPQIAKSSSSTNTPFILFLILILLILGTSKEKIIAAIERLWPAKK